MIHRECGVLKTTYEADMALYPLPIAKYTVAALAVLFFLVIPTCAVLTLEAVRRTKPSWRVDDGDEP